MTKSSIEANQAITKRLKTIKIHSEIIEESQKIVEKAFKDLDILNKELIKYQAKDLEKLNNSNKFEK